MKQRERQGPRKDNIRGEEDQGLRRRIPNGGSSSFTLSLQHITPPQTQARGHKHAGNIMTQLQSVWCTRWWCYGCGSAASIKARRRSFEGFFFHLPSSSSASLTLPHPYHHHPTDRQEGREGRGTLYLFTTLRSFLRKKNKAKAEREDLSKQRAAPAHRGDPSKAHTQSANNYRARYVKGGREKGEFACVEAWGKAWKARCCV